jgi:hypothetical protein
LGQHAFILELSGADRHLMWNKHLLWRHIHTAETLDEN